MNKRSYRCENEWGSDPCEFARSNYEIPEEKVSHPMDGGNPRCPGKTASGAVCGHPLVLIRDVSSTPWRRYALIGGSALAVVALVGWLLWRAPEPSPVLGPPDVSKPINPPQPSDPWWVYRRLESSSAILSKEP